MQAARYFFVSFPWIMCYINKNTISGGKTVMNVKKNELRMQTLEKLIHEKGFMRICELAEMFDVSEMTIRRDIYTLEKQGIAKNLKGIVFAYENTSLQLFTKQYDIREESNMQP